jgi:hypothetical protein
MACNCGKKAKPTYVYTSPAGTRKEYKTEVEAQAATIRNKGGSYVTLTR